MEPSRVERVRTERPFEGPFAKRGGKTCKHISKEKEGEASFPLAPAVLNSSRLNKMECMQVHGAKWNKIFTLMTTK